MCVRVYVIVVSCLILLIGISFSFSRPRYAVRKVQNFASKIPKINQTKRKGSQQTSRKSMLCERAYEHFVSPPLLSFTWVWFGVALVHFGQDWLNLAHSISFHSVRPVHSFIQPTQTDSVGEQGTQQRAEDRKKYREREKRETTAKARICSHCRPMIER